MQVATGKSILNGIAIGPLRIYKKAEAQTTVSSTLTPEEEYARFDAARVKAQEQLGSCTTRPWTRWGRTMPPFLRSTR